MTLVPSRQLRLSGSRFVALVLVFISFLACSTSKRSQKTPPSETPKTEDKVRVYDPASGLYVLVPREAVKVDTIKWTEDPSAPIVTDTKTPVTTEKKDKYDISLLVPFNASEYNFLDEQLDPKLVRFLQYYAGMEIAANEFKTLGYPITVRSFDTKKSLTQINDILKDPAVKNTDVLVGPYDKENVESVAAFGLQHEKVVVSPWLPAFTIDETNPYFIQVVPGLNTHAEAIIDFIGDKLQGKKIFLVARNNPTEISRLQLFKKNPSVKTEDLIIDDTSVELEQTNLMSLLEEEGTIFILPYYSRTDESFVNSFLRKLHADKELKEVIVFGLPQWTAFNNLNPNYMESLSVHISSSTFVDVDHPFYHDFIMRFFNTYHALPDQQAFMGYDLLHWLGKTLTEKGKAGLLGTQHYTEFGLASGFDIKPVFKTHYDTSTEMKSPLYYENSRVRILKYINQDFTLVR